MGRVDARTRGAIRELIDLLEKVRQPLRLHIIRHHPDHRIGFFCEVQDYCRKLGIWAIAALVVYDGDEEALKNFTKAALLRRDEWPSLTMALVENHLKGQKDWRQADNATKWMRDVADKIARKEAKTADARDLDVSKNDALGTRRDTEPFADEGAANEDEARLASRQQAKIDAACETIPEKVYSFEAFKAEARPRSNPRLEEWITRLEAAWLDGLDYTPSRPCGCRATRSRCLCDRAPSGRSHARPPDSVRAAQSQTPPRCWRWASVVSADLCASRGCRGHAFRMPSQRAHDVVVEFVIAAAPPSTPVRPGCGQIAAVDQSPALARHGRKRRAGDRVRPGRRPATPGRTNAPTMPIAELTPPVCSLYHE